MTRCYLPGHFQVHDFVRMLRHPLPPSPRHLLCSVVLKHQVPLLGSVPRLCGTLGTCFAAPQVSSDTVTSSCSHHPSHSAPKPNESPPKLLPEERQRVLGQPKPLKPPCRPSAGFLKQGMASRELCLLSVCCQLIQTPLVGLTNNTSTH